MQQIAGSGTGWAVRRKWVRGRLGRCALTGLLAIATMGCPGPTQNVVVDANGNPIRFDAIQEITSNAALSDAEKRDKLRAMGITNEDLINLLIRDF